MVKKIISDTVSVMFEHDEFTRDEIIARINRLYSEVENKDTVTFSITSDVEYECSYARFNMNFDRLETDTEYTERLKRAKFIQQELMDRDRKEFERLQAIFASK